MQPSDSLPPLATTPVPLVLASLDAGACCVPLEADDTCARHVPCVGDGSPALRQTGGCRGEARASQGTGPSSSCVPWSSTPPAPIPSSPRRLCRGLLLPSGKTEPSASGKTRSSGAACPGPTRSHAYASPNLFPQNGARLAIGSGGLTLGRARFAPAGRYTMFHGGIASPNPLRPTGPGRTVLPSRCPIRCASPMARRRSGVALSAQTIAESATGIPVRHCHPPGSLLRGVYEHRADWCTRVPCAVLGRHTRRAEHRQ